MTNTVLITGTSKGLGYYLAKKYLSAGNIVIGVARNSTNIQSEQYYHLLRDICSVNFSDELEKYLESIGIENIDILINNAGMGSYGANISSVNAGEVLRQIDLHCVSALRTILGAKKYMINSKIVNITSRLGSVTQALRGDFKGQEFSYGYRIAKAAQNMLSLCLANDSELSGSKILSINPGLLQTDSGSYDAEHCALAGADAVVETIESASVSGIYHAFGQEILY